LVFTVTRSKAGSCTLGKYLENFISAAESPAELYCDQLASQNDGEGPVIAIMVCGYVASTLIAIMGWCLCTAGCTCCCCCAREKWCSRIATSCSKGCNFCWGSLLLCCGCGWFVSHFPYRLAEKPEKNLVVRMPFELQSSALRAGELVVESIHHSILLEKSAQPSVSCIASDRLTSHIPCTLEYTVCSLGYSQHLSVHTGERRGLSLQYSLNRIFLGAAA
jgi:hypothetical protein